MIAGHLIWCRAGGAKRHRLLCYNQRMDIQFECEVRQVKTLADGSANITFNLPEYELDKAALL